MMELRALLIGFLIALVGLAPNTLAAQTTPVAPAETTSPPTTASRQSPDQTSAQERALVRQAVENVYEAYKRSRTADGIGGIAGGLLVAGVGAYFYFAGSELGGPEIPVLGIGIALSAIPQIVAGVWNVAYSTPQEDIAAKLLNDDALLDGAGLLFVEQEARRAKRSRLVGGTTSIAGGAALLGSYYLYSRIFGGIDILLIFFGIAAALQTVGGVITLVGLSGPEKAYRNLLDALGRSEEPAPRKKTEPNRISKTHVVPTLLGNEGKLAPGFGLSLSF